MDTICRLPCPVIASRCARSRSRNSPFLMVLPGLRLDRHIILEGLCAKLFTTLAPLRIVIRKGEEVVSGWSVSYNEACYDLFAKRKEQEACFLRRISTCSRAFQSPTTRRRSRCTNGYWVRR